MVSRHEIEATYEVIRPHVRVTPIVEIDAADFGLAARPLVLKLELMQHAGSFKTRGAFANLIFRTIPPEGVVAASGGNHGAAVAYAAMRRGVRARIFVPTVSRSRPDVRSTPKPGASRRIRWRRGASASSCSRSRRRTSRGWCS